MKTKACDNCKKKKKKCIVPEGGSDCELCIKNGLECRLDPDFTIRPGLKHKIRSLEEKLNMMESKQDGVTGQDMIPLIQDPMTLAAVAHMDALMSELLPLTFLNSVSLGILSSGQLAYLGDHPVNDLPDSLKKTLCFQPCFCSTHPFLSSLSPLGKLEFAKRYFLEPSKLEDNSSTTEKIDWMFSVVYSSSNYLLIGDETTALGLYRILVQSLLDLNVIESATSLISKTNNLNRVESFKASFWHSKPTALSDIETYRVILLLIIASEIQILWMIGRNGIGLDLVSEIGSVVPNLDVVIPEQTIETVPLTKNTIWQGTIWETSLPKMKQIYHSFIPKACILSWAPHQLMYYKSITQMIKISKTIDYNDSQTIAQVLELHNLIVQFQLQRHPEPFNYLGILSKQELQHHLNHWKSYEFIGDQIDAFMKLSLLHASVVELDWLVFPTFHIQTPTAKSTEILIGIMQRLAFIIWFATKGGHVDIPSPFLIDTARLYCIYFTTKLILESLTSIPSDILQLVTSIILPALQAQIPVAPFASLVVNSISTALDPHLN